MYTLLRLSRFVWLGCEVPRLKRIRRQLQCKIAFCNLLWWRFLMPVVKLKTKVITLTSHVQLPHIIQWINRWIKNLQTKFQRKTLRPSHTFVSSHCLCGSYPVAFGREDRNSDGNCCNCFRHWGVTAVGQHCVTKWRIRLLEKCPW